MKIFLILLILFSSISVARASWIDDMNKDIVDLEVSRTTREMLNQFPFAQVLDDYLCMTSGVRMFEILDKRDNEKKCIFYRYWDNCWILRKPIEGTNKYTFEVIGHD